MSVHSHSGANKAANKHMYIGANINQQTQSDTHSNTYSRAPLWKFHSLCPESSDFETNGMYQSLSLARQSIKKKEKKKNVYSIMKAIANHFLCLFKHACSASSVEITALERARQSFWHVECIQTEDGYFSAQQLAVWAIFIGHFIQLDNHQSSFFRDNINDKNCGLLLKYVLILDQRT